MSVKAGVKVLDQRELVEKNSHHPHLAGRAPEEPIEVPRQRLILVSCQNKDTGVEEISAQARSRAVSSMLGAMLTVVI